MTKFGFINYIISVLLLTSCVGGRTSDTQADVASDAKLLFTVPSDALAVIHSEKADKALEILDSLNAMKRIDLGKFESKTCALSWCYTGTLSPLLAISVGKSSEDSTFVSNNIIAQAERLKLHWHYIPKSRSASNESILLLSKSEALIASSLRHISEGRSIVDAPHFSDAASGVRDSDDFMLFSGKIAQRVLPREGIAGFSRSQISKFVDGAADWVIVDQSAQKIVAKPYYAHAGTSFASMLESLPAGSSEVYEILPDTTHFAISIPIQVEAYRIARESYLDASVKLTSYRKDIEALKKLTGKSPLNWEKELNIQEVAIAKWEDRQILLVRPKKAGDDSEIKENPYKGFIPLLYGDVFKIEDDSYHTTFSSWHLFGSKDDLESFINYPGRILNTDWHEKKCHLTLLHKDNVLCWNKNEISLWNINQ